MTTRNRNEIITANLERLIEVDGRNLSDIVHDVFPLRSPTAGRKMIERSLQLGWLQAETVDGLMRVWGIDIAEFYLPIDPPLSISHMKRMRLRAANAALRVAGQAFTGSLRSEFDRLMSTARSLRDE